MVLAGIALRFLFFEREGGVEGLQGLAAVHFEIPQDGVVAQRLDPLAVFRGVGAGQDLPPVDQYGAGAADPAATARFESQRGVEFGLDLIEGFEKRGDLQGGDIEGLVILFVFLSASDAQMHGDLRERELIVKSGSG